jgi:hypothetical protein
MESLSDILAKIKTLETKLKKFLSSQEIEQGAVIPAKEYMECFNALTNQLQYNYTRQVEETVLGAYKTEITKYVKEVILPAVANKNQEALLDEFSAQWENFKTYVHWMRKAFIWIDQYALPNQKNKTDPGIQITLTNIAYEILSASTEEFLREKFFNTVYDFLARERSKDIVPRLKIQRAVNVYNTLCFKLFEIAMNERKELILSRAVRRNKFYEKNLETALLERLKNYYKNKSQEWLAMAVPEYLVTIEGALTSEEAQCVFYYEMSKPKVLECLEHELISVHIETLIKNDSSGLYSMIDKKSFKDLTLFYKLSKRGNVQNSITLGRNFSGYIENIGAKINEETKDPIEYTKKFLDLKRYMDEVVSSCFENDIHFQNQRDNGFKHSLNQNEKSPGFMATYLDFQFVKDMRGKTESEIEEILNTFIKLFAYLYSRDAFLKIYAKLLAKRLINNSSFSFDTEKDMVKKLGAECGKAPVNKIDTMLNDISLSKDYQKKFSDKKPTNPICALVLTSGNWPALGENDTSKMPAPMLAFTKEYEVFYKGLDAAFSSRILKWVLAEGKVEMALNNQGQKFFLDVKIHQACILLLFEKENSHPYEKIQEFTGLKDNLLNEYLKFMCSHAAVSIFKREREIDDPFSPQETISFNQEFKSAQKKIILFSTKMTKNLKEKGDAVDNDKAMKELEQERGFQIDALAVRVMKHRKALKFNSLIEEVIRMCTIFQPQIPLIKKRIEALIEKGYFMRDEKDKALLIYVP